MVLAGRLETQRCLAVDTGHDQQFKITPGRIECRAAALDVLDRACELFEGDIQTAPDDRSKLWAEEVGLGLPLGTQRMRALKIIDGRARRNRSPRIPPASRCR